MASMHGGTPTVPVLRRALNAQVGERSLRHVAREAGMTPAGLQKFIEGGAPYSATRRKLERWYVLHGPGRDEAGLRGESALTILRVLVQDVAPGRHRAAMSQLVGALEEAYATARLPRPEWLAELHQEMVRLRRA